MKKLVLILMLSLGFGCIANVSADRYRDVEEAKRKCVEISRRCNQAATSARSKSEYDRAADICHEASRICIEGVINNRDLLEQNDYNRRFLERHDVHDWGRVRDGREDLFGDR
jgi:hypothetical protein